MEALKKVVAVVRAYNTPEIAKQTKNLLSIGVGRVVVVVNAERDNGSTIGYLGDLTKDPRVQVLEILKGYTWSVALNRALMSVQMKNLRRVESGKPKFQYILNISIEALVTKEHLEKMIGCMANEDVAVVGTTFDGRLNSNRVDLGTSYRHPRNTCMLIRLDAFGFGGGFLGLCDDRGGMEDLEFILRLRALAGREIVMQDLSVPLVVGKNYHQPTKEASERWAMDTIIGYWRSHFSEGTKERNRIDAIIREMRLED